MIAPIQPNRQRATITAARSTDDAQPASNADQTSSDQAALLAQQNAFNSALQERAELLREFNELRALQIQQLKHDDEIVKKWIELI